MRIVAGLGILVGAACGDVATTTVDAAAAIDGASVDAAPACGTTLLQCGADCIDPATDNLHCGATGDCAAGNSGAVCLGDSSCVEGTCTTPYSPVGPQFDVPTADLVGWTPCYADTYGDGAATLDSILTACGGTDLLLGCRPTGQDALAVLAWADRTSVTTDTGTDQTTTFTANGTAWYFNPEASWGFAAEGDAVNKDSCDYDTVGPQRMCWHTGGATLTSGYRCGDVISFEATYERLIYTR